MQAERDKTDGTNRTDQDGTKERSEKEVNLTQSTNTNTDKKVESAQANTNLSVKDAPTPTNDQGAPTIDDLEAALDEKERVHNEGGP